MANNIADIASTVQVVWFFISSLFYITATIGIWWYLYTQGGKSAV